MTFDISANDRASSEFLAMATAAETLKKRLDALDRVKVEPKADLNVTAFNRTLTQLEARIAALRDVRTNVEVTGAAEGRREVSQLVVELRKLSNQTVKLRLDAGDTKQQVTTIRDRLKSISDVSVRIGVDDAGANTKITRLRDRLRDLKDTNVKLDISGNGEAKINRLATKLGTLKQLSPIKIEVKVDDDGTALGRIAAIQSAAAALGTSRPNIQVTADIAAAAAQIAAMQAAVNTLGNHARIRVDIDGGSALNQLARIQRDLSALAGGKIKITADTRQLMSELARARIELQQLQNQTSTPQVDADITAAQLHIRQLEEQLHRIAARQYTANVDVDKSLASKIAKVTNVLMALGAAGATAAAGLGVLVPAAATLGGSLASLVGLAPLAVGGLASLAVVVGTVKAGMVGMSDAFKNLDDPKKFAEALKDMAPAGREFAIAVRDIAKSFEAVRLDTQAKLFAGWGAEVKSLGQTYLPLLKSGMGGVATELNLVGKEVLTFAKLPSTVGDIDTIFKNTKQSLVEARPAAVNMAAALTDIGVVGTSMLPELAGGLTSATGRFREFISEARQSGQLKEWIQGGLDTLSQLGSVAGNVGSILGSIFTAAKASGADFLSTLDRVTEKVAAFFKSSQGQSTLVAFFKDARAAIDALLPGLSTLGEAAATFIKNFADSGGLERVGQALSKLAESAAPLVASLGTLAGDTLAALATAAQMAGAGLAPLLTALVSVLGAIGPLGPAILGAVVAFKALGPASAALATLGTRMGAFAASMGASQAAATRITSAVTAFGRAIPIAGVALVAGGAIVDHFAQQIDDATQALIMGEKTAQQTFDGFNSLSLENLGRSAAEAVPLLNLFVDSSWEAFQKTAEGAQKAIAAMSPLQLAQRDLSIATREYNDAVKSGDPAAVAAAQGTLAAANARVAAETEKASEATKSFADKQRDLVAAVQTSLGAMLNLETAVKKVADAQKAANDAAKQHGESSAEAQQAYRDFVGAADQAAQAAQKDAEARAKAAGATDAATAGTNAYGASLLQMAGNASGPAQQALLGYIGRLSDAELGALNAGVEASGFATKVMTLPDGRTVKIAVDPETGKIIGTQELLDALRDKTVVINGDTVPVETALARVVQAISEGKGEVTINGQTMPADQALQMLLGKVDISTATVTINGQDSPAQGVLTAYLAAVDSGSGVVTINGKDVPAQDVLNSLLRVIAGSRSDVTVGAVDNASSVIDNAARDRTATIYVKSVVLDQPAPHVRVAGQQQYHGGIVAPMANGGVLGMASGGTVRNLRPMSNRIAQMVKPNTWRVMGDRVTDDEAFIPLNRNLRRSHHILNQAARRMGYSLAPQGAFRRYLAAGFAGRAGVTRDELLGAAPRSIGSAVTPLSGGGSSGVAAAINALGSELRSVAASGVTRADIADLTRAVRSARGITVEDRSGNPTETARRVQLAGRFST